jgi:hypothetical protein
MTPGDGPEADRPRVQQAARPLVERPGADRPVTGGDGSQVAGLLRAAVAVAAEPRLWRTAARQVALLARPGWWRTRPHLPVPDPAYLEFRLHTAYGGGERAPDPADVVAWLRWCARMGAIAPPR